MASRPQVFINDAPVQVPSEGGPVTVRDLIQEYGTNPDTCQVFRLRRRDDPEGEPVNLEEPIALEGQRPLFFRCITSDESTHRGDPSTHTDAQRPQSNPDVGESRTPGTTDARAREANVSLGSEIRRDAPATPEEDRRTQAAFGPRRKKPTEE